MNILVRKHVRNGNLVNSYTRTIYKKYHDNVNMSYNELKKWKQNPAHKEASLSEGPIDRNLVLLSKPETDWSDIDVKNALRTISFNRRMRAVKAGKPVAGGLSKRTISLKNWAWDPNKS